MTSKDLIAKCQAEEIPGITNHMSTVSLGLAATIREWFGEEGQGGVSTAVQTAAPVDIATARAKAKKKVTKKTAAAEPPVEEEATPAPAAPEAPEAPAAPIKLVEPEVSEPAPPPVSVEIGEEVVAAPPDEAAAPVGPPAVVPEPLAPAAAAPAAPEVVATPPEPTMNVPQRPQIIQPAGPKLEQPMRTKLSGPKVIRVESPEVVTVPRARIAPAADRPAARGPRRGWGAGTTTVPPAESPAEPGRGRRGGAAGGASRRNKRRTATAGDDRGRTARATSPTTDRPFNWRAQDLEERRARLNRSGGYFKSHRRDTLKRSGGGQRALSAAEAGGKVKLAEPITVKSLSAATGVKAAAIQKALLMAGTPTPINSSVAAEIAIEIMLGEGIELEVVEQKTAQEQIVEEFRERQVVDERSRSPVVTILGHVDHGKTSLLDRIRNTRVAEGEAGGITQATSAFRVPIRAGDRDHFITFIDTPGHEAFTEMRARGAKVTDLVVLVVAADDGVMPQTVESIDHAKAAGVPIVVALNKMDKPQATDTNIQRILGQLAEHELNPVEWGGSTEVVRTSATTGDGVQDLLEIIDYQAQLLELTADFGGLAEGTVIEARMEEGRGPVADVLVQQGTLRKSDFVFVGRAFGRVRDIIDDRGQRSDHAPPSAPIAFSGIDGVPDAGDKFYVVKNLKDAEASAGERRQHDRQRGLVREKITLDNIFEHLARSDKKELPLIIKGDVQGSVDTLKSTVTKITTDEVIISIKHAAVGGINDSDILLAEATGAIIIGFNVTATASARRRAEDKRIDIRLYEVIYDVTDDLTQAAEGLLDPELKLEVLGHADVRQVFRVSKVGMIAGCYVTDGVIQRNAQIRVTRNEIVVETDRRLEQLKRFKDDAKEVRVGQECGMRIDGYDDIKVGDVLECYITREVRRKL